jgi:hypothetical protein
MAAHQTVIRPACYSIDDTCCDKATEVCMYSELPVLYYGEFEHLQFTDKVQLEQSSYTTDTGMYDVFPVPCFRNYHML